MVSVGGVLVKFKRLKSLHNIDLLYFLFWDTKKLKIICDFLACVIIVEENLPKKYDLWNLKQKQKVTLTYYPTFFFLQSRIDDV